MDQRISFVRSKDGTNIAYALSGEGPPLVRAGTWLTHIELDWESPVWSHWFRFMSKRHTLVRYDPRGCGLSQRDIKQLCFEDWVDDLEAVVDTLGLDQFPLFGLSQGAAISIAYALRHPQRVSQLILYAPLVRGWQQVTSAVSDNWKSIEKLVLSGWGERNLAFPAVFAHLFIPEGKPEHIHWYADMQLKTASKEVAAMMMNVIGEMNLWSKLKDISVPTLVVQVARDQCIPPERVKEIAALIPGCAFASIDSNNHILLEDEPGWEQFKKIFTKYLPCVAVAAAKRTRPDSHTLDELSKRERQILAHIAQGLSNREISQALFISEKTVRNHITNIFSKLDLASRSQAIVLGKDLGL
jgi:pimeloyl-ACP methyl ester carboxylesterase/DNA-binding CsgD family transcriptional regulator